MFCLRRFDVREATKQLFSAAHRQANCPFFERSPHHMYGWDSWRIAASCRQEAETKKRDGFLRKYLEEAFAGATDNRSLDSQMGSFYII